MLANVMDVGNDIQAEKRRAGIRRWYHENKGEYNKKRSTRYANDPDYRANVIRLGRESMRRNGCEPKGKWYTRTLKDGSAVQVCTVGVIAKKIGKVTATIRIWEDKGWIPSPEISGGHRLYFPHQVDLVIEFCEFLDDLRSNPRDIKTKDAIKEKAREIAREW